MRHLPSAAPASHCPPSQSPAALSLSGRISPSTAHTSKSSNDSTSPPAAHWGREPVSLCGSQSSLAKHLANVRMPACPADDPQQSSYMFPIVLVEVRGTAARFDLALRLTIRAWPGPRNNPPRTTFRPSRREAFRPSHRARWFQFKAIVKSGRPADSGQAVPTIDDGIQLASLAVDRFQSVVARLAYESDRILSRPKTRRATRQKSANASVRMPWNLSTLRPSLPVKPASARPCKTVSRCCSSRNQTPLVTILSKRKFSSVARRHMECTNSGKRNGSPPVRPSVRMP